MEIKALIDAAEATSTRKIKEEEKRVNTKFDNIYQILLKKKSEIQALKEEVELALTKGDEYEFLEVGLNEDGGMRFPPAVMLLTAGPWARQETGLEEIPGSSSETHAVSVFCAL